MNDNRPDVEFSLRALQWRTSAEGVLEKSLEAALAAHASMPQALPRKSARLRNLLPFIPSKLRWPLAACWAGSFAFWALTPREKSSPVLTAHHASPSMDSAALLAERETFRQQTHELLLALEDHGRRW